MFCHTMENIHFCAQKFPHPLIPPWSSWLVVLWKKTLCSQRSILYLNLINTVVKQKQVENFICDLGIWRLEEDSIFNIEVGKSLEKLLLSNHLYLHRISITQHRTPSRQQILKYFELYYYIVYIVYIVS